MREVWAQPREAQQSAPWRLPEGRFSYDFWAIFPRLDPCTHARLKAGCGSPGEKGQTRADSAFWKLLEEVERVYSVLSSGAIASVLVFLVQHRDLRHRMNLL